MTSEERLRWIMEMILQDDYIYNEYGWTHVADLNAQTIQKKWEEELAEAFQRGVEEGRTSE